MDPATSGYGLALWLELDPSFLPSWMPQASSVADSLPPAVTVVQNPHLTLVARLSATQAGAPEAFVAAAEELVASIPAPFLLAPHQDIIHSPVKYAATDTATTGLQALAVMFHEDGCGELFALRAAAAAKFGLASSTEPTHGKYEPHMSIVYWTGAESSEYCRVGVDKFSVASLAPLQVTSIKVMDTRSLNATEWRCLKEISLSKS
ncbi:hypothetical protein TeGR_g13692 [Tetraparma gracilis]|uniref:Cyclic phosphodiesterase n=1 Tax=Tetraparma gracilis TaxID=2962635 RepID=A0ABQ6MTG1_9STRA|nr:hypothetical protein TeGR_g13692 [Tetraparma gracilis]